MYVLYVCSLLLYRLYRVTVLCGVCGQVRESVVAGVRSPTPPWRPAGLTALSSGLAAGQDQGAEMTAVDCMYVYEFMVCGLLIVVCMVH